MSLRGELPVGVREKKKEEERRGGKEKKKREIAPAMHADARVYAGSRARNNNLPPLITSTVLSPEVH